MGITKKAISVGLSATMLATLLATAFVGTVFAATTDQGTYWNSTAVLNGCSNSAAAPTYTAQCSQVADGSSTVAVFFGPSQAAINTAVGANGVSFVLSGGATFVQPATVPSGWTFNSSTSLTLTNAAAKLAFTTTPNYLLLASATAGTGTITVSYIPAVGTALYGGLYTVSFVSAGSLALNVAGSYVGASACGFPATSSAFITSDSVNVANGTDCFNAILTDGNGNPVTGAQVTFTITPYGLLQGTGLPGQTVTAIDNATSSTFNGITSAKFDWYSAWLNSSDLSGKSTITTTVYYRGVSYTLPSVTFTWYGDLAKIALTSVTASAIDTSATQIEVADVAATDAAGNAIACPVTGSAGGLGTVGAPAVIAKATVSGNCAVVINAAGALNDGTYTVSASGTTSTGVSITSNTVTFVVSDGTAKTVTVTPAAATVAPAGTVAVKVTVLDDNGTIMPDGTKVTLVASQGAVVGTSSTGTVNGDVLSAGAANFLYLSQTATGPVTLTALTGGVSGSASVTVGTAATSTATSGSALGLATSGFSATTKIAKLGQYVTWQFGFGSAAAGKNVTILWEAKSASGTWPGMKAFTGRIADANGNVTFHWKFTKATWISVEGQLGTTTAPARQARWM